MMTLKPSERLILNFSTLSTWSKGRIDEAIDCYFHKDTYDTDAMVQGRAFHKSWEKEIKTSKQLKIGKTTISFTNPRCELLIQTKFNDRWDIKGTMDCIDGPTLYEFKSGKTKGLDFAGTMQIPIYFLINDLVGVKLEKAVLLHFDQYRKKTEYIVVWNDEEKMMGARNWIETLGAEIEDYWMEHGIPFDPDFYKVNHDYYKGGEL